MDRYFSLDPAVLRNIEDGIEDAWICARMGRSLPQFVTTAGTDGRAVPRFMVTIDYDDQAVLLPIPDIDGVAVMTDLDLLVASGVKQDGFPGYFLTGNPHMLGSFIADRPSGHFSVKWPLTLVDRF